MIRARVRRWMLNRMHPRPRSWPAGASEHLDVRQAFTVEAAEPAIELSDPQQIADELRARATGWRPLQVITADGATLVGPLSAYEVWILAKWGSSWTSSEAFTAISPAVHRRHIVTDAFRPWSMVR